MSHVEDFPRSNSHRKLVASALNCNTVRYGRDRGLHSPLPFRWDGGQTRLHDASLSSLVEPFPNARAFRGFHLPLCGSASGPLLDPPVGNLPGLYFPRLEPLRGMASTFHSVPDAQDFPVGNLDQLLAVLSSKL